MAVKQVIKNKDLRNGCAIIISMAFIFIIIGLSIGFLIWGLK